MQKYKTKPPKPEYVEAMRFIVNCKEGWPPGVYKDGESPTGYKIGDFEIKEGDYVMTAESGVKVPIPAKDFEKDFEPAYGESVDIAIRVVEEPPEDGHGIKFYIIVRVDRHTFGLANVKNAQNLVRQQFQYALPEVLKAVDQEHAILNRPAVRGSK